MSHAIKAAAVDQIAFFRAYDTDGTAKVNLTSATAGLALSVFRIGASAVSISSLSDKAADNTAHADGAIRQIQGNLYTVDLPDAAQATQVASICVKGTYTGGVIEGVPHPVVGYDGTATAVGANTTAPATPTDVNDAETAILAAIDGSGTGARTVTITVNDGAAALQNARVRLTEGANTYTALTNVSGVATFNVDDATYTVAITKSGYTYAGTTLVVNGDETATYSMTEVVVAPPSSPSLSAIEVLCLGADDTAESGIDVDFRIVSIPSGDQNKAYSGAKKTITSDANGIARIEVAQGSTYEYKRGAAQIWSRVTVDADGVTNVTSFIGSP